VLPPPGGHCSLFNLPGQDADRDERAIGIRGPLGAAAKPLDDLDKALRERAGFDVVDSLVSGRLYHVAPNGSTKVVSQSR
jgi:hypothetical protein